MNISLTPELKDYVAGKVASGMYNSASEVMREALRALMVQEQAQEWSLEELQREVAIGIEQLDRGEFITYSSADEFADAIKREGRARLAERVR